MMRFTADDSKAKCANSGVKDGFCCSGDDIYTDDSNDDVRGEAQSSLCSDFSGYKCVDFENCQRTESGNAAAEQAKCESRSTSSSSGGSRFGIIPRQGGGKVCCRVTDMKKPPAPTPKAKKCSDFSGYRYIYKNNVKSLPDFNQL